MLYSQTYPNTYIRYYASNMILNIDSDDAYLLTPVARSKVVGCYLFSADPQITKYPHLNGVIHGECKILRNVLSSAAGVEVRRYISQRSSNHPN